MSWHDEDFVRCAYVTILGRQPDPEGEYFYVDLVRQGASRLDILWRMRRSAEGRRHDPGIRNLDRKLRKAAWQRLPAIGRLFGFFDGNADGNSFRMRTHRARMNAATTERHTLYGITLKLGGIEWLLSQHQPTAHAKHAVTPVIERRQPKVPRQLKHLAVKSPLARFVAFERA